MPNKEELEFERYSTDDLRFEGVLMRHAYNAGKSASWTNFFEVFLGRGKLSVWTSAEIREFTKR